MEFHILSVKNRMLANILFILSLFAFSLPGLSGGPQDRNDEVAASSAVAPATSAPSRSKKESVLLEKQNFSTRPDIDFQGLYGFLKYRFQSPDLLVAALYPLLPKTMRKDKRGFEHLEFLGDGVLGALVRSRILSLFPNDTKRLHNDLYTALVCNITLTEVYRDKLMKLESFLPYPGEGRYCKYCNVVEAIMAAMYKDSGEELKDVRRFVGTILDDSFLRRKWESLGTRKESPRVHPEVQRRLENLLTTYGTNLPNPKTFLLELLSQITTDQPRYSFKIGKDEGEHPLYIARVEGAIIGDAIFGKGETKQKAEENAAAAAVNFLAHRTVLTESSPGPVAYSQFVFQYCQSQNIQYTDSVARLGEQLFKVSIKINGEAAGEGQAGSIKTAKEEASKHAFQKLYERQ